MNLPNILTMSRIVLIPVMVVGFYLPFDWRYLFAALVFGVASGTDWLDGYLARRWDQSTPFGAFLDPVADKLMVAVALVMLVGEYHQLILTIPALIIVCREMLISALREWMAEMGSRTSVAVSFIGKVKTASQMCAIFFLLANPPGQPFAILGLVLLYLSAVLTLWSMLIYLKAAWLELHPVDKDNN